MTGRLRHRLLRVAGAVLFAAVFAVIAIRIRAVWGEVVRYDWSVRVGWLAPATFGLVLAFLGFAAGWRRILCHLGYARDTAQVIHIWFKSQLGKYLPGFVWPVVGRSHWGHALGIPRSVSVVSAALEAALMVTVAILLGSVAFVGLPDAWSIVGTTGRWLPLLAVTALLVLHPAVVRRVLHLFGASAPPLPVAGMLRLVGVYGLHWAVAAGSFAMLVHTVYPLSMADWPLVGASFLLAWAIGFIAVFAPGGFGVREGILLLLLEQIVPPAPAVVAALLGRLWWIAGEIGGVLLSAAMAKRTRTAAPEHAVHDRKDPASEWRPS